MDFDLFQGACVAILAIAYTIAGRAAADRRRFAFDVALLVVAAWVGEQTCISRYRFYAYADGWWLRLGDVPALIPLIWPMVILSARDVVGRLAPNATPWLRAGLVAAAVVVDASLMEVIAVAAGLWAWAEPGFLDVPLIGILGWGFFGLAACLWLDATAEGPRTRLRWLLPVVSVAATHALLVVAWWGGLRWGLRGDLGHAPVIASAVALAALAGHLAWRTPRERRIGPDITVPRVVAASIFFVLLAGLEGPTLPWLALHTAAVALPYLAVVDWRGLTLRAKA